MAQQHQPTLSARQRIIIGKIDTAFARETDETDHHGRMQDKLRQIVIESFAEETLAEDHVGGAEETPETLETLETLETETKKTEDTKEKSPPEVTACDCPPCCPRQQYKRPRNATMSPNAAPLPPITEISPTYLSGLHGKCSMTAAHGANASYTQPANSRGQRADRNAGTSSPFDPVGVGTHCVVTPSLNIRYLP